MKIITININGLKKHHLLLIQYILKNNIDICCIQEVLCKRNDSIFNKIEKETKGIFYVNSNYHQHGTAILIRGKLLDSNIKNIDIQENIFNNRLVHIQIKTEEIINIFNIYAPVEIIPKTEFYLKLNNYLTNYFHDINILLGDFNYVSDNKDRNHSLNYYDKKISKIFNYNTLNLLDTFRTINMDNLEYTYKHANITMSRLDRIYISQFMATKIQKINHTDWITDHRIVELHIDLEPNKKWGNYYWIINNAYFQNLDYRKSIIDIFNTCYSNNTILDWEEKKKEIAKLSKKYSKNKAYYRNLENKIAYDMVNNITDQNIKNKIHKKIKDFQNFKNNGYNIRIKNKELKNIYQQGHEINRKKEIRKGNNKYIGKIDNTDKKDEIITKIENFYTQLYTSQNISENTINNYLNDFEPPQLNNIQQENIGDFITESEVEFAINKLNDNKSPGYDGITAEFYKTFSSSLKSILANVYNNIYLNQELSDSMKIGIITLIYKNKGLNTDLKNWRPISLLNIDYKILTKILTNRLKNDANLLINSLQSCGPRSRSIINNALNLKTLIDYIENENQNGAIISIDQEKAFDRIEHNYLLKVLEKKLIFLHDSLTGSKYLIQIYTLK